MSHNLISHMPLSKYGLLKVLEFLEPASLLTYAS